MWNDEENGSDNLDPFEDEDEARQHFEEMLQELQKLRRIRDQADARFLLRLMKVERSEVRYLKSNGFDDFEGFAKTMTEWSRYTKFKRGVEKIGPKEALEIGSEATIEAGKTTSTERTEEFVDEIKGWVEDNGGMFPTKETAERYRRKIDPQKEPTRRQQRNEKIAWLEAENRRLRADVRKLEAENKKLKKEIEKLKT